MPLSNENFARQPLESVAAYGRKIRDQRDRATKLLIDSRDLTAQIVQIISLDPDFRDTYIAEIVEQKKPSGAWHVVVDGNITTRVVRTKYEALMIYLAVVSGDPDAWEYAARVLGMSGDLS